MPRKARRKSAPQWKEVLLDCLPRYGHRNWIVVADSAYPAQSRPGIETIVSGAGQLEAVSKVLDAVNATRHVRANVYLDQELAFLKEASVPGISRYREQLDDLLKSASKTTLPHEQIIAKLDQTAQLFRVLIVKTEMTMPYTTVFFELGCGYWNDKEEQELRRTITAG